MSEKIVQLNKEVIKGQLKELVRGGVEKTLNELMEAEAPNTATPTLPSIFLMALARGLRPGQSPILCKHHLRCE